MDEEKTIFDALKGDYNDKDHVQISYFVHEAEMARQERTIKRLWILCIIMFLALVITNAGWIVYENQFEDVVITQEGEADDGSALSFTGLGSGTINNYGGERETNNQDQAKEDGR